MSFSMKSNAAELRSARLVIMVLLFFCFMRAMDVRALVTYFLNVLLDHRWCCIDPSGHYPKYGLALAVVSMSSLYLDTFLPHVLLSPWFSQLVNVPCWNMAKNCWSNQARTGAYWDKRSIQMWKFSTFAWMLLSRCWTVSSVLCYGLRFGRSGEPMGCCRLDHAWVH